MLVRGCRLARRVEALKCLRSKRQAYRGVASLQTRKEGDISDAFTQLSGQTFKSLPQRFADLKARLIAGHEDELQESWQRLLGTLSGEIHAIENFGPKVVPEIDFTEIDSPPQSFVNEHKKRGVAIIRNVISESTSLRYKDDLRAYIKKNPQTKAFPPENPQVFELYWSPTQISVRSHPNLLKTQRFLMSFWHSRDADALISTSHPATYCDRLRIRLPGDNKFALGPHMDSGSVERWEEDGYGRGRVYENIFAGHWEDYDPWESSCRLPAVFDKYNGAGACSAFRMYQGWLSMSSTGPNEGTLLVNPLLGLSTTYLLLRPFFSPTLYTTPASPDFLHPSNWRLNRTPDSWLQGANPGTGQELLQDLHPHLHLDRSMVHIPRVQPGDYVAWHCDTIHAVDSVHAGAQDSSVLYIPTCPLTELNATYLRTQREAFESGFPAPDFPGGVGESRHIGRPTRMEVEDALRREGNEEGLRAFGLSAWDDRQAKLKPAQRATLQRANRILGFED